MTARREALRLVESGSLEVRELLSELTDQRMRRRGIGGGTWSPKDLVGHLAAWELNALEAVDAWSRGDRAPIDLALRASTLAAVNARQVAGWSSLSLRRTLERADDIHARLVAIIASMSDSAWAAPPTTRSRRGTGARLGGILGGPAGPFRHAGAHVPDLRAFVAEV